VNQYTGYEYIKIDIANNFGLDKLTFANRIKWVDDNKADLTTLSEKADSPILYAKGLKALEDAEAGEPTGFIMSLDATASGTQILACFMGCHITAANVNLINTGNREDVYLKIATKMSSEEEQFTRSELKNPIMTTFYGSKKQPERIFGKDSSALLKFYEVLDEELPGAMEAMKDMQCFWNPDTLMHSFTMPDGHVACIKVMEAIEKKIEIDELDHKTFTHRIYINKPAKKGLSLAANITHAVDAYVVREMQRRAYSQGFEMLTIHDSFWASPNNMQMVRENYANILADISDMNLLQSIFTELNGSPIELIRSSHDLGDKIRESEYALS
jgi:hypothetical protein